MNTSKHNEPEKLNNGEVCESNYYLYRAMSNNIMSYCLEAAIYQAHLDICS